MVARTTRENVWLGRDNVIQWLLMSNDTPVADLSALTRVALVVGAVTIDSDSGGDISWADQQSYKSQLVDVITIKLGGSSLVAGLYDDCRLVTYDATNPNGIVWSDDIRLQVN